jgi:hypothetical protein
MSIEYRSRWLRAPEAGDVSELARALAAFGKLLGPPQGEVVGQIVLRLEDGAGESGPDVTVYADTEGVLVSFHSGTRTQRAAVLRGLDQVLSTCELGTPLEED